ncbi:ATPase [Brumimicrobium salinarum]|uniref:ATPase n=1 Tax=Brumimicrobium salinarum TaxID=2058658 RepID=A0A2I0R4H1_9FLAO|nr:MoxR family ATPase [Brumimicrobium salinarum]PKR81439.1 ATPase [Brumimicrobium salinarum]
MEENTSSSLTPAEKIKQLTAKIQDEKPLIDMVRKEMSSVIVGQGQMLERLMVALMANGHILLEGVPGLAKTLAIKTMADVIGGDFSRIQFTPDLLPADVTGTQIYNQKTQEFSVTKGPIFANFILADEINRAPAKVQSALLEAMQERQITIGDETFQLPKPFLVLATQNPIEQEGTYPLPEAQVDRFMLKVTLEYPSPEEEMIILRNNVRREGLSKAKPVMSPSDVIRLRNLVREVYLDEKIEKYIIDIVFATRDPKKYDLSNLAPLIAFGASPRASINLALAGKANAFLEGRAYVIPDDIRAIASDVIQHRLGLTYEAEAEGVTARNIVEKILSRVEVP